MNNEEIMKELNALDDYFMKGRKKLHDLREKLGLVQGPAPSGDQKKRAHIIEMIEARAEKKFSKASK